MATITRSALDKCATKGCPFTREEHDEWMERCARGSEHGHRHDQPTHAHFPKKGMGGNNPKSKIVAVICWPLHDSVDNGLNGMGIAVDEVRFWDVHNNTILRGPIGVSTAEAEDTAVEKKAAIALAGGRGNLAPVSSVSAADAPATSVGPVPPGKDGDGGNIRAVSYGESTVAPSYNEIAGRIAGEDASPRPSTRAETSPCYSFLDNGIECEEEITFEQAIEIALRAASEGRGRQWKAGDAVNIIERFGERAAQYVDVETFAYPEQTLSQMANVARIFPLEERRSLPWSYHQSVAKHEKRLKLLDNALAKGWDRATLREAAWGKKPKVQRWTISALREKAEVWDEADLSPSHNVFGFLDWLEQE